MRRLPATLPLFLLLPLFLSLLLAGCAATRPSFSSPPPALFADELFKPPSEAVDTGGLFALSPAMRDYLHGPAFAAHVRSSGLEQGLVNALYNASDLMLDYDASTTRNAADTYAERAGNCLSLVIMTAAFARELGLTTRFQSVDADDTWSRAGSLYLASAHVNIALGRRAGGMLYDDKANKELLVDFLPAPESARLRARQLEENDIVALFRNNRAVETLAQERIDDAYWWARAAVTAEPRRAVAYNTLGVVYQRRGRAALAERAYRAALEREPENLVAMQNLVPLLEGMGRAAEAAELARRVAGIQPTPPYHYFNKGMAALQGGDYGTARQMFEREVARAPYSDEFHFWLAIAHLRLGEAGKAREQLALAVERSVRRDMRDAYSAKLAHLRRQGADMAGPGRAVQ